MNNRERLWQLLYGRDAKMPELLGGDHAKFLADAADEIERLRAATKEYASFSFDITPLVEQWKLTIPKIQHVWGVDAFLEWVRKQK